MKTTRFKCTGGESHTITFHDDGRVVSSGCGDVTSESKRVAGMIALGASTFVPTCAGLASLVQYGIASIFSQAGAKNGDELPLEGWRSIYMRFESLKMVEETIKRERRAARIRRNAIAMAQEVPPPAVVKNAP